MYVIEFAPPMSGFEGTFNTVRLGIVWNRRLAPGDTVFLMNKPKMQIFGKAIVRRVIVGRLEEVAPEHAAHNHNQTALGAEGAPERFIAGVIKRYGPHKVGLRSLVTIIYLEMEHGEKYDLP